jgi:hypothetical protein
VAGIHARGRRTIRGILGTIEAGITLLVGLFAGAPILGILRETVQMSLVNALLVAFGGGAGAMAVWLWCVVRLQRDQRIADEASIRPRLKRLLREWAAEGEYRRSHGQVMDRQTWRNDVRSLLMDTLGPGAVAQVFPTPPGNTLHGEVRRLRALSDELDDWALRAFDFAYLPPLRLVEEATRSRGADRLALEGDGRG